MRNTRRRLYVDQAVQGGIALRLTIYWLCSFIMAFVMLVIVQCALDPHTPFFTQLGRAKSAVFPVVASFFLLLPIVLRDIIRLTNRFAGPIVRLKQAMRDLREGKHHGALLFRTDDYWQDLAEEFNLLAWQVEAWKNEALRREDDSPVPVGAADE